MESIVDKIRSRIDLLNTLYPHEHGRYYVDHEYGGYKLFFATAYPSLIHISEPTRH